MMRPLPIGFTTRCTPNSSGILRMSSTEKSPPHKSPDNDNDDPPAVPLRVAVPMPVPMPEAEPRHGGLFD
jgi:hypothetical protein